MGPVDTGPGTLASARQFLEGRWQLETFEIHRPGQPPLTLKGSGTLIYDDMSNLRMEVRADEASADMLRAAGVDIRDGMISTEGRTAIDLQNRTLTYVARRAGAARQGRPARDGAAPPLGRGRRHPDADDQRRRGAAAIGRALEADAVTRYPMSRFTVRSSIGFSA